MTAPALLTAWSAVVAIPTSEALRHFLPKRYFEWGSKRYIPLLVFGTTLNGLMQILINLSLKGKLSLAVPILSSTPIFALCLSALFLARHRTPERARGVRRIHRRAGHRGGEHREAWLGGHGQHDGNRLGAGRRRHGGVHGGSRRAAPAAHGSDVGHPAHQRLQHARPGHVRLVGIQGRRRHGGGHALVRAAGRHSLQLRAPGLLQGDRLHRPSPADDAHEHFPFAEPVPGRPLPGRGARPGRSGGNGPRGGGRHPGELRARQGALVPAGDPLGVRERVFRWA